VHSGNPSVTQVTAPDKSGFGGRPTTGCNRRVPDPATPPPTSPASPAAPTELALAPALRLRLLGTGLVAIGLVVALGVLVGWVAGLPSAYVSGLVVLAAVGALVLGFLVGLRHWVVRLDETGYRVRVLRTAQARSARWTDVLDLQSATVSGTRCLVLRLRDGRTTALPVDAIEGGPTVLSEELTSRLDRGHGYRRLR
jgi:hypothetical protein